MTTSSQPRPYDGFDLMPIAGKWRTGRAGHELVDLDPWSGEVVATIPLGDVRDVHEAHTSAVICQQECAQALPEERAGAIVPTDIPGKESRVYRRPVGEVGLISPWDFPLYLTNRTLAPALALGNSVVLKPSSQTPVSGGLLLAKILEEAGLPDGVLSVVVGSARDIGDRFVPHPASRVLSSTGSTETGIDISHKARIKRLLLELGGTAALVVLDDADLEHAVEAAVFGSFYNSGQICMIANRLIVDRTVMAEFVERFVARVTGGPSVGPAGLALTPHVLVGGNDLATAREEVFGPAITVTEARDEADALRLANDTEYGLSSAVHTSDADRGLRFALALDAGMTHINDSPVNEEDNTAYGGEKLSGLGRFGGAWSVDEFTTHHWVSVQNRPRPYSLGA